MGRGGLRQPELFEDNVDANKAAHDRMLGYNSRHMTQCQEMPCGRSWRGLVSLLKCCRLLDPFMKICRQRLRLAVHCLNLLQLGMVSSIYISNDDKVSVTDDW